MEEETTQAPIESTQEPEPQSEQTTATYTETEVRSLLEQAIKRGGAEVQSSKDREVAKLQRKVDELESLYGFAQLSDEDRESARDFNRYKTSATDALVELGIIPEDSKRRLQYVLAPSSFWDEVKAIHSGMKPAEDWAKDALSNIRKQPAESQPETQRTAADERIRVPGGPPPRRTNAPPSDPNSFWAEWERMKKAR